MTSKILVFIKLAGQLRKSRHWQGYQRAGVQKTSFTMIHQMNDVKNHVGCLSKSIKKADKDIEKIRFFIFVYFYILDN